MIPKNEMEIILDAFKAYGNWSKLLDSIPSGNDKTALQSLPSLPDKNIFSLDDTCEFGDKNYTVRQLIAQAKRKTDVGKKFTEAVYQEGQNQNSLEEMASVRDSKDSARLYAGDREIPASVLLALFGQSPEGKKAFKLMDYVMAIHRVTHPKGE